MVKIERTRYVNPHKRRARAQRKRKAGAAGRSSRKHRGRKNPVELLSMGFVNPTRRGASMAHRRTKRKGNKHHGGMFTKRRRSNPSRSRHHSFGHRRRRRNPGGIMGQTTSILKSGFYALVGLVIARQLPQWALGARNTGWLGYGANLVSTILAAMVGSRMFGVEVGKDVALGGGLYTVNRIIQDQLSPVGKVLSISGLGDYNALGDIQPGYFPLPVPTDANGQPIIPAELRPAPVAMATGKGMAGISRPSRYANRF